MKYPTSGLTASKFMMSSAGIATVMVDELGDEDQDEPGRPPPDANEQETEDSVSA